MKVFSIYDVKASAYDRPFFVETRGLALRMLGDAMRDEKSTFAKYPGDFQIFELGDFHNATGIFSLHNEPVCLGGLSEFVTPTLQ